MLIATLAALIGFFAGRHFATNTAPSPSPTTNASVDTLVPSIVAQAAQLDGAAFADVIKGATGRNILAIDSDAETDREIIDAISVTMNETLTRMNAPDSPVRGLSRINEASRFFEDSMQELLDAKEDFSCNVPLTAEGEPQRSGYPDLRLLHHPSGRVTYIDPKLFENKSKNSSLRTFYFEPKTRTNKVLDDAHHLLVGVAHDGNDGAWEFLDWHLVDLSRFQIDFKAEFQAGNKDLYRPELIIISGGEH